MADSNDAFVEARELRLAIGRVSRRIRRLFTDAGDGLAFLELGVLDRLNRSGSTSPGELSENEGVTGPAIAGTLRHLEELGLLERAKDPDDGRRVVVTITDAGRTSIGDRDTAIIRRIHEVLFADFDKSELATLMGAVPLIERMAGAL